MNRKEFIVSCGLACVGTTVLTALLQGCGSTIYYAQTTVINNQIVIKKSEFINAEETKATERKFVLVKSEKFSAPICIYKLNEDNYSALPMKCTHKACELRPHGDYLVCPCHGSEFSNKGIVQNPPAQKNLQPYTITTDNDSIYIRI